MAEYTFLKYLWTRIILTIPFGVFALTQEHYIIIWGIIFIIIIDTVLGIWVSIKHGVFISYKLGRISGKIARYFLAMASVWIISSVAPSFGWTFQVLGVFLIMTELFSNFEKLAILGLKIPTKLLSKLNNDFHEYANMDELTSKKALKRILNKEQKTDL